MKVIFDDVQSSCIHKPGDFTDVRRGAVVGMRLSGNGTVAIKKALCCVMPVDNGGLCCDVGWGVRFVL